MKRLQKKHSFETSLFLQAGINDVFKFFSNAQNLELITPKELCFQIITPQPIDISKNTIIDYHLRLRGFPFRWRTQITIWKPPNSFVDKQIKGPFIVWEHSHSFLELNGGINIIDQVRYQLPFWPIGELFYPLISAQIQRIFSFRQRTIKQIFESY